MSRHQFPAYALPHGRQSGPTDFIQSLSCTDVSTCWGIAAQINSFGGIPALTTDGGRHWNVVDAHVPLPNPSVPARAGLVDIACPQPTTCFAVGGDLIMGYSPQA
jgi:hypothetical protein